MPPAERLRVRQYIEADPLSHPDLRGMRLQIIQVFEPKPSSNREVMYAVRGPGGLVTGEFNGQVFVRHIAESDALPARALVKRGTLPRVVENDNKDKEPPMQSLEADVLTLATRYHSQGDPWDVAARKAGAAVLGASAEKHDAYRGVSPREPVMNLSGRSSEREVSAEIQRVADEHGISFAEAGDLIIATGRAVQFKERVMKLVAAGHNASAALNLAQQEDPEGATAWREAGLN